MKVDASNSFCFYPFYQIAIKSFNKEKVSAVAPCCNMMGSTNPFESYTNNQKDSFQDYFYSEPMEKLRKQLIAGEKPECCNICWNLENKGLKSHRFNSEHSIPDKHVVNVESPKLVTVDIATGNNCNLRCRMCSPLSSNKLNIDYNKMSPTDIVAVEWTNTRIRDTSPKENTAWKNFLKDHGEVVNIKAVGGEPFITDEFINLLKRYIETGKAKNTRLEITTNGTKFSKKIMELLNEFKFIFLILSIDSVGKHYEYIRYPMPWKNLNISIDTFFERIKTHFDVVVSTPIMIYNVFTMDKLCEWAKEKNINHVFCDNVKPVGRGIDIIHIPNNLLQMYYDKVKPYYDTGYFRGQGAYYLEFMTKNSVENKTKSKQELAVFDKIRNQNYENFLDKEIVRWLNEE